MTDNKILQNDRAKIYGIALRRYLATGSSDYAYRGAAEEGTRLKMPSLRVDEIARDAVEKARSLQREYNHALLYDVDERVLEYCEKFVDRGGDTREKIVVKSAGTPENVTETVSGRELANRAFDDLDAMILLAARLKRELKTTSCRRLTDESAEVFKQIDGALKTIECAFTSLQTTRLSNQ